jgi:AmiR/NasT family two-component response regulator
MSFPQSPDFERERLLLIDCDDHTLGILQKSLQRLGIQPLAVCRDIPCPLNDCFAALVELENFASPTILATLHANNLPIVALTRHETLSQVQRGISLGATAVLNRPITQSSLYTTLMMAIALQAKLTELETRNGALERKLASRPLIAQALALLIVEFGIDEAQAYDRVRTLSMTSQRSVEDICLELLGNRRRHHQERSS